MNDDRRKVLASVFADTAKYSLAAGVIGAFLEGRISLRMMAILGCIAVAFCIMAYFVTPKR